MGLKNAYIERAFGLPQGEIDRQVNSGDIEPALLVLMKLVATYPWLLEVADAGYKPEHANLTLAIEALKLQRNCLE